MADIIKHGTWQTVLIDISVSATLSAECDLGHEFNHIMVLIPTIQSATISVQVSKDGTTFFPVHDFLDSDADNTVLQASTAGTGGIAVIFKIGSARFIKLLASATQTTTDKTFYVKGFDL